MSAWLKEKAGTIAAVAGTIAAFVAVLQLSVVGPMNQRFDAMERHIDQRINDLTVLTNQRFDAQDQRLDRLADEVVELRKLTISIGERVSRSEGQIEIIREQIKTVDAPQIRVAGLRQHGRQTAIAFESLPRT